MQSYKSQNICGVIHSRMTNTNSRLEANEKKKQEKAHREFNDKMEILIQIWLASEFMFFNAIL